MVLDLERAIDPNRVGGKAAALGKMLRGGFSVPTGTVIPTTLFEEFLDGSGRRESIEVLCQDLDPGSPESTAEASSKIVAWLKEAPLPAGLSEALQGFLDAHGSATFAIRSSAVGEDSARASFAGQLDSFLDVANGPALLEAIRNCWCSFYSARGLAYQAATGVSLRGMAVIVQTMVHGAVSGVTFTQSPTAPQSLLIEYCEGGCDALVSGDIVPHSLSVPRSQSPALSVALLTRQQVKTLVDTFMSLEQVFGGPQDVEWTIDAAGTLHILQSRPITTASAVGERVVYSNANINENYPGPVTPFLQSVAQTSYEHYFRNLAIAYGFSQARIDAMHDALVDITGVHAQRLYYDVSNIHAVFRMAPWGSVFAQWFNDFVGVETQTEARERDMTWRRGVAGRTSETFELLTIGLNVVRQYRAITAQVEQFENTISGFAARCSHAQLRRLEKSQLIKLLEEFIEIRSHKWLGGTLADSACMVCCGVLESFLARYFPDEPSDVLLHGLLRGLPGIVSSEPPKQLWDLSRQIRRHPDLTTLFTRDTPDILDELGWDGEAMTGEHRFAQSLQQFLDDWGFRCTGELMMTTTSFQEDPSAVIDMLRSYSGMTDDGPAEVIREQGARRLRQTAELSAQLNPVARKAFVTLLRATGGSLALRERARLKQALLYRCCRRIVLSLGDALVAADELNRKEDVLFMSWQELLQLRKNEVPTDDVVARKARFEVESAWPEPPNRIVMRRGESWSPSLVAPQDTMSDDDGALSGLAAAAGTVVGRATVALGQQDFHRVAAGDILVAPQTDPGWATVLFLVRGLVMERGGMLSHGAIIAREFGIPSVVGVKNATERIPNGADILVDGDEGNVRIVV